MRYDGAGKVAFVTGPARGTGEILGFGAPPPWR